MRWIVAVLKAKVLVADGVDATSQNSVSAISNFNAANLFLLPAFTLIPSTSEPDSLLAVCGTSGQWLLDLPIILLARLSSF